MTLFYETHIPAAAALCSICQMELPCGYHAWQVNGLTVCQRCFPDFALAQYRPYEIICGREVL